FEIRRVRHYGDVAKIEVPLGRVEELREASVFTKVESEGGKLGFRSVTVDPDGYRSGNLNRALVEGGADAGFTDVVTLEPSRRREGDGAFS
ncbi:MAG: hypothetical protein MK133_06570, partial [Planctomycetes bacterium]|nr:hypothetical protein [Planctomycetota bacterium]